MKAITFSFFTILLFIACGQSGNNDVSANDSASVNQQSDAVDVAQTSDKNTKPDFFIISVEATADIKDALSKVKNLKSEKHPAGYLWMPDYESLSKKDLYSVFIGPFSDMDTCIKYLEIYKKTKADAYAVKVQHNKERIVINSKYDIRVNDVKQFIILTYSTPKDEKEYADNGGEDWGWFTNDVQTYFNGNFSDKVIFSSVYNGWLSPADIKMLEKELQPEGFGYVLIKGKDKLFLSHNLPDAIITGACEFFGLEYIEPTPTDTGD